MMPGAKISRLSGLPAGGAGGQVAQQQVGHQRPAADQQPVKLIRRGFNPPAALGEVDVQDFSVGAAEHMVRHSDPKVLINQTLRVLKDP